MLVLVLCYGVELDTCVLDIAWGGAYQKVYGKWRWLEMQKQYQALISKLDV